MSTSQPPRLRRSVLYVPGSNERALEKGRHLPADVLMLDLEDPIPPDQKDRARRQVCEALAAGGYGERERVVRINRLDTPWGRADLDAVAAQAVDAVCLPKVESPGEVIALCEYLEQMGVARSVGVWIMAETAAGVLACADCCRAHPRVRALMLGTSDLMKDLRIADTPEREGLLPVLSQCVVAARAAGLDVIDGVFADLEDTSGFASQCEQARAWGFDGKILIHPRQLAPANTAFAPDARAQAQARNIVAAWEAAGEAPGVIVVEGKMVEQLHVDAARQLLAVAARAERRNPE